MDERKDGFTRRQFLAGVGATVAAGAALGERAGAQEQEGADRVGADKILGPGAARVRLTINGQEREVEIEPRVTLLDLLRDRLDLTGAKKICDRGACGGCTVLLDDEPINSCLTLAIDCDGRSVRTIEGLATGRELTPLQSAFVRHDALQCGYCTPGMVLSAHALLAADPDASDEALDRAMSGNICRCGTYVRVRDAIKDVLRGDRR